MNSGIYLITNLNNGKLYVGQAQDFERRWQDHKNALRGGYHKNPKLQNSWDLHGEKAFHFRILEVLPIDLLNIAEQYWLDTLRPWDNKVGYNIAKDAVSPMRGLHHSDKVRQKLSEVHKGKHPTEEAKQKMSEAGKGKRLTEETRQRISEANKGKRLTEETRQKMSEANKGKCLTEETRQKMSEAKKGKLAGEKNPNYGKGLMPEFNGEVHSIAEWAKIIGINPTTLNMRINELDWSIERALLTPTRKISRAKKSLPY